MKSIRTDSATVSEVTSEGGIDDVFLDDCSSGDDEEQEVMELITEDGEEEFDVESEAKFYIEERRMYGREVVRNIP